MTIKDILIVSENFEQFRDLMIEYLTTKVKIRDVLWPSKGEEQDRQLENIEYAFGEKLNNLVDAKNISKGGKNKKTRKNRKLRKHLGI